MAESDQKRFFIIIQELSTITLTETKLGQQFFLKKDEIDAKIALQVMRSY